MKAIPNNLCLVQVTELKGVPNHIGKIRYCTKIMLSYLSVASLVIDRFYKCTEMSMSFIINCIISILHITKRLT